MIFDPSAAAVPGSGIFGLPCTIEESKVVIIPVPFEATTSYRKGTAKAPEAILVASHQVDLDDHEVGRPYEAGIAMLPIPKKIAALNRRATRLADPIIKAGGEIAPGDIKTLRARKEVHRAGKHVNGWVYQTAKKFLGDDKKKRIPVVLGGDHSVAFGAIQAYAERYPGLGILQIDAHADLREAFEGFTWSHASVMFNVANEIHGVERLVQVGLRDLSALEVKMIDSGTRLFAPFYDSDIAFRLASGEPFVKIAGEIVSRLPERVYASFDIDGLDPSLCPHTGTPVPGGLSFNQATILIRTIKESGRKIVGFDLVEVAPGPRGDDWDANVGARMLYKLIGFTLLSQQ